MRPVPVTPLFVVSALLDDTLMHEETEAIEFGE